MNQISVTSHTILHQYNPKPIDIPAFCQPGFFFNETAHLRQQLDGQFHLLSALNQRTGLADARCAFFIKAGDAVSPGAAPFGSIEFVSTLPDSILDQFLCSLSEAVKSTGATMFRLITYPHCYAPEQSMRLGTKLLTYGFQLIAENPTFFLSVSDQNFDSNLVPAERRRLRKCQEAGFGFEHQLSPNISNIVKFVQKARQQQGYPLPVSADYLSHLLRTFPDHFSVFTVSDNQTLAAMMITVRIREDILYSFLPASNTDYRTFSPMVMLHDGLYTYCQQQGIQLLDLGLSLDSFRLPKPSLMRFKHNLGAQESPKQVFEKQF
ncbi:GNAT family N-acetyltransferase [Spirosoma jeollabukense]